jgi:hypothetical protein
MTIKDVAYYRAVYFGQLIFRRKDTGNVDDEPI